MEGYQQKLLPLEEHPIKCEAEISSGKGTLFDVLTASEELSERVSSGGILYGVPKVSVVSIDLHPACKIEFNGQYNRYSLASVIKSVMSKYGFAGYYSIKSLDEEDLL